VRYDVSQSFRAQVAQLIELPAFKDYQFVWERGMTYLNFQSPYNWHVDEGVAVFSRFPITRADYRVLSRDLNDLGDKDHQRVCLRARIQPPGCRSLDFLVTHLTLSDTARHRAVSEIIEWVGSFETEQPIPFAFTAYPTTAFVAAGNASDHSDDVLTEEEKGEAVEGASVVLVGDMNAEPASSSIELFLKPSANRPSFIDSWLALHPDANDPNAPKEARGLSFPAWEPQKRIDFILVKQEQRAEWSVEVRDVHLMGNTTLAPEKRDLHREVSSDHLGLCAVLSLPPSSSPQPRPKELKRKQSQ
jgi:endonuclease/exonuclease/phosphatase family metal-dependent hydrolase